MAKRFEGSIKVDPRKVGSLIGKRGSNLKRVSQAAGHGAYIVAFNASEWEKSNQKLSDFVRERDRRERADSFYISATSVEAVRRAAGLLKNPKRPSSVATVSSEAIGTIIGRGGSGLKGICQIAGDHCYIVHKHEEGGFVVTADTKSAVARGVQKIKDAETSYFQAQRDFQRKRYQKVEDTRSEVSNRFDGLDISSDEDDRDEYVNELVKPQIKLGFRRVGTIASRKGENRQRWAIRQQLLERKIDELEGLGNVEAAQKLSIHDIPWEEVSTFQIKTTESRSARRIQLSVEKKSKAPNFKEFQPLTNSEYTMPNLGKWASGVSEDVLSNEGIEDMKKVYPKPVSSMFKPYTGSWADAADTDSEDEENVDLE
jgi:hypothetical protein